MPTAASYMHASFPKRAPPQPSLPWNRWSVTMAASASFIPIVAAISARMNPRAPSPTSRTAKSAGHYGPSASVRSWPIHPKPAAEANGPSAPFRDDCHRNSDINALTITQQPTTIWSNTSIPDFNRRFTIKPAQPESAFVKLTGIELELVLSSKHERVVRNDNTVSFQNLILQLPSTRHRMH